MATVTLDEIKQGEAKTFPVTVKRDGAAIDVTLATFTVTIKETKAGAALVTVADGSFDKTDAVNGNVTFPLSTTDTTTGIGLLEVDLKNFFMEIKTQIAVDDVDISTDLILPVRRAVAPT